MKSGFSSQSKLPEFFTSRKSVIMKNILAPLVGLSCLLFFSTTTRAQGLIDGFQKGGGNFDLALSYSYEQYSDFYVGDQKVSEPMLGDITTQSINLFAAVGITDRIDAVLNLPYIFVNASNNPDLDQSSIQDLSLCLKGRLLQTALGDQARLRLLASAGLMVPLNDYVANAPVAVGHRATALDGRLLAQVDFGMGLFAALQGGYIWRGKVEVDGSDVEVPDAVDLILRTGIGTSKLYGDLWLQWQNAGDGTDIGPGVPFPSNAVSFLRIGGNVVVPVVGGLKTALGLGYTLTGENVGKALRVSGSIIYQFDR